MTFPEWTKPGVYGAITGAVAVSIIGFSWGGWMTSGKADKMAQMFANEEVAQAMVPVCLEMSAEDPERESKLAAIREAKTYNRRNEFMKTGWATQPGTDKPNRALAEACIDGLEIDA